MPACYLEGADQQDGWEIKVGSSSQDKWKCEVTLAVETANGGCFEGLPCVTFIAANPDAGLKEFLYKMVSA